MWKVPLNTEEVPLYTAKQVVLLSQLIPILTAVFGGWVGAYFGSKYQEK